MEHQMRQNQIGFIGGSGSGKTTMMVTINKIINRDGGGNGNLGIVAEDDETIRWIQERRTTIDNGFFPNPTGQPNRLKFVLSQGQLTARLEFEDRPGGDFNTLMFDADYLLNCGSIIFLLNPSEQNTRISNVLNDLLTTLDIRRGDGKATAMPFLSRVAVCLNQYDDHKYQVFQCLRDKNLFSARVINNVNNTPCLTPDNVIRSIRHIFPDYSQIINVFRHKFIPANVQFFGTSSIGFYRPSTENRINWDDCDNVSVTPNGDKIRIDPEILTPVNIFAPFNWVLNSSQSTWETRIDNLLR